MKLRLTKRTWAGLTSALGLLLLSALWAVSSLLRELNPHLGADSLAPAQRQAALFSVFAVVAAFIAVAHRAEFPRGRRAWANAAIGLGLFVIPSTLVACARSWVSNLDRVVVFSLTPVFAVVLEPYLQGSAPRQGKNALAGALAAVAGILLIFPLDIPSSFHAGAALCALVAAAFGIAVTNCFAVRLARNLAGRSTLPMAAQASTASAICFATAAAFTPHAPWSWGALPAQLLEPLLIDLPTLFLLFWLMRRLGASRMAARFLLAPLLAIVAGMALEATFPPVRGWLGIALLAGGAGWLVFAPAEEPDVKRIASLNVHTAEVPRQPQTGA
jgi:drug/metabolite transporter (DMT)-like permease